MTIHLPENLEAPILTAVHRGRYASLDDAMIEAASLLVRRPMQERAQASQPTTADEATLVHKPIWEAIEQGNRSIPPEVWAALLPDPAEQHDHYVYGTPKRPPQ
jgi:Arc/MetJ-type ribon-helix-helix transcriptional regulator